MAPKRAIFITFGSEPVCEETKKFIEEAGVLLTVRDLGENPFSYDELKKIIGHINLSHFLNSMAPEYSKLKLDSINNREEVLRIIAENNSILQRPIIKTPRLMTVGCNKKKIAEMLQISFNGTGSAIEDKAGNIKNSKYVTRRTTGSKSSEKTSESASK